MSEPIATPARAAGPPPAPPAPPESAVQSDVNPFTGPDAIGSDAPIFGRDREIRELRARLIADRIVLMYSPSGAGKTSLINAGGIDTGVGGPDRFVHAGVARELEVRKFHVLGPIRLNRAPAPGDDRNRFTLSMLASLDPSADPAALASRTIEQQLADATSEARTTGAKHVCLFFDQFEELLTADPGERGPHDREEFVRELGAALRRKAPDDGTDHLWALFSMREDYLARLDEYLPLLPTRLQSRFRLDLLTPQQATTILVETATRRRNGVVTGIELPEEVAAQLVDRVRGDHHHVEPLHLQLVGRRVWQTAHDAGAATITGDIVEQAGDVDVALANFYDESIRHVATASAGDRTPTTRERQLRLWVEDALITDQGFRRQSDAQTTGEELDDAALDELGRARLVTTVDRGVRWYELSHDRLAMQVRRANDGWYSDSAVLAPLPRRADRWHRGGRRDADLLGGSELRTAKRWRKSHPSESLPVDDAFLAESDRHQQLTRTGRWVKVLVPVVVLALLGATLLWYRAARSEDEREREANKAAAAGLAAQSQALRGDDAPLALAIAAEAAARTASPTPTALSAVAGARAALRETRWRSVGEPIEQPGARRVAVSPDGSTIAVAGCGAEDPTCSDDERSVIHLTTSSATTVPEAPLPLGDHGAEINELVFTPDGTELVSAGESETVRFWDLATLTELPARRLQHDPGDKVNALAFDPTDPTRLATGTEQGMLRIWDLSTGTGDVFVRTVTDRTGEINDLAFRTDGRAIATAESLKQQDPDGIWVEQVGETVLWEVADARERARLAPPADAPRAPRAVAFAPETECPAGLGQPTCVDLLVVGHEKLDDDEFAPLWAWENPGSDDPRARRLADGVGHTQSIESVAFDPSGSGLLATASGDSTIRLWQVHRVPAGDGTVLDIAPVGAPLTDHGEEVDRAVFTDDGRQLVSSSRDRSVRVWREPQETGVAQLGNALECGDRRECFATAVAFGPGNDLLVSAGYDGYLRRWQPTTGEPVAATDAMADARLASVDEPWMHAVDVHPDGSTAIASGEGVVVVWTTGAPSSSPLWVDPAHAGREPVTAVRAVVFDPVTGLAASGDDAGTIRIWDVKQGEQRSEHALGVRVDALVFGSGRLWAGTFGGAVVELPVDDDGQLGAPVETQRHEENVRGIALGLENRLLATGSRDQSILVSDLENPTREPLRLLGHANEVGALAFVPTGDSDRALLASASNDGTAHLWWIGFDAQGHLALEANEQLPASRACHDGPECFVLGVASSPDSAWLATASSAGLVHVWERVADHRYACDLAATFVTAGQLRRALGLDEDDERDRLNVCFQDG